MVPNLGLEPIVQRSYDARYKLLLDLTELNELTEKLSRNVFHADDWLFLSAGRCEDEADQCIEAAVRCVAKAKQTLEQLEDQIMQAQRSSKKITSLNDRVLRAASAK